MSRNGKDLEQIFKKEFPIDLLRKVAEAIAISYELTHDYVFSNFRAPIARNLLPYHRWANIDDNLLTIAENNGIRTNIDKNVAKNCSHVKYLSESFIVTANATSYPSEAIREAKYRNSYAEANYPYLYPEMERKLIAPYYATFLHGWYPPEFSKPGFIYVGFPSPDFPGYVSEPFNLAAYCGVEELIAEFRDEILVKFKDDNEDDEG
jgi:hypothetical protein